MSGYLDTIAAFAAETRYEDIPAEAIEATKWIVLDTLGGMLASSTLPEVERFARLAVARGGAATSTLVGFADRADPSFAAMLNATSACSYETDEGNRLGGGHPAIHVLPPSLATAEAMAVSGRRLLETVAVSYEVMSRLAAGSHARWPVHSHGTHGSPGAAVAVAHLRDLDAAAMKQTLNLAACMSPATTWQVCFEGGIVRNIYPAESCFLGMLAVDLAACGYSGAQDGPAEVFGAVLGTGSYDPAKVLDGLGERWRVTENYFKQYASCRITHPPLDAIYSILRERRVGADEIESITVDGPWIAGPLGYTDPSNMLAAKFSIPYSVATAVVRGSSDVTAFEGEALTDPAIRSVAAKVRVREDERMNPRGVDYPSGRVAVALRDGTTLRAETFVASGDALNPVSRDTLLAKYRFLAGMRCDDATAEAILDAVMSLDALDDVTALHPLLTGGTRA